MLKGHLYRISNGRKIDFLIPLQQLLCMGLHLNDLTFIDNDSERPGSLPDQSPPLR
jgi:hypothetical protein